MKCFYHPTVDAVGSCKHCCRGLCVECAAERDGGLACRNRHEATVDAVSTLVERNVRITKRAWQSVLLACIVFCGAGGVFIYLLFREFERDDANHVWRNGRIDVRHRHPADALFDHRDAQG